MSRAGLAALLFLTVATGCARQIGKNAAAGAVAETRRLREETPPDQQAGRVAAERAVEGALATLERPDVQARLKTLVDAAVADAVRSALRVALATEHGAPVAAQPSSPSEGNAAAALAARLGRAATAEALGQLGVALDRDGTLRQGIASTSAAATDVAVASVLERLFPGCEGSDAVDCRRAHVAALTRTASANVAAGVRDALAWPLMLLAALVGVTAGVFGHWLLTRRQTRPRALRHA